ncbi:winged helix-turn-helix DNA-binding domain protein [Vibrio phage 1.174.O._10N.261.55.A8]|nr:winged helix-turn-helix DNA-binding domain protein [Vibrio phage 1.174.O._10N.261.55.A8]
MRKIPSDMVAGTQHMTNKHGKLEVVEYADATNVRVKFVDNGYETTARAADIRNGNVKDYMSPSVYGVGFMGKGGFKSILRGIVTKEYKTWVNMLGRCYDQKYQTRCPTYVGCSVCKEWHNFQNFAEWMATQDHDGKQLDKDIKVEGNKVYSPDTCTFVTPADNTAEACAKHYAFLSPDGLIEEIYNLNSFCSDNGLDQGHMSQVHLGKRNQHKGWRKA